MSRRLGNRSKLIGGGLAATMLGLVGPAVTQPAVSAAQPAVAAVHKALRAPAPADRAKTVAEFGKLPLRFEANVGQVDPAAKFVARTAGGTVFLTNSETVLSIGSKAAPAPKTPPDPGTAPSTAADPAVVRMHTLGANPQAQPEGVNALPGVTNYLIGNDRSKWRSGVTSYGGVRYRGVYPGVDEVFNGKNSALEYTFEVSPGADPATIALGFDGASAVTLDAKSGELVLHTAAGDVRQAKPVIYQGATGGARRPVTGGFVLAGNQLGFKVGDYDHTKPLVIDPTIAYSALIGGTGDETVAGIAVDPSGSAYVAGTTNSADYPTKNPLQGTLAGTTTKQDMFVTKLTPDGSALAYSTYLGGTGADTAGGISVDPTGVAYVAGSTGSPDFPMAGNSFDTRCGTDGTCRSDATYPDGNTTAGSTSLTSRQGRFFYAPDVLGRAITGANIPAGTTVAAVVNPTTLTLSNPATATGIAPFTIASGQSAGTDAVMAKLTADGSALTYSTYLGGNRADTASGISVGLGGNVFVTGTTTSTDFPTTDGTIDGTKAGLDRSCGTGIDAGTGLPDGSCNTSASFTDGSATAGSPTYTTTTSTFNSGDLGRGITGTNIAPGTSIAAVVNSKTITLSAPATGTGSGLGYTVARRNGVQRDAFLTRINTLAATAPASLAYSTYLGGGSGDDGTAVAADPNTFNGGFGGVYVVGETNGRGFPTTPLAVEPGCDRQADPQAPCTFGQNAFVVKLNTLLDGTASLTGVDGFGTYLGSRGTTQGLAVTADLTGVYVTGRTDAPGFPTKNAFQQDRKAGTDAFVTKLTTDGTNLVYSTFLGGNGGDDGRGIAVDTTGAVYVSGSTQSTDFPVKDSIQGVAGGYLAKLTPSGSALDYSTYLSVSGSVATNPAGDNAAYVAGSVQPIDFPALPGSLRSGPGGGDDAAVVKLVPGDTPVVSQVTPKGGPLEGGVPVVITGEKFTGATAVRFGDTPALRFTVNSPTQITAISPPHAPGSIAELTTFVTVSGPQATSFGVGPARYVYGEGSFLPTGSCVAGQCPGEGGQMVTLQDGRVLFTNGAQSNRSPALPASSQIYNPATGTWSATGACTGCGYGNVVDRGFTITVLADGKVLVAGGRTSPNGAATAGAFVYDPTAGTWSATGSMSVAREDHTATLLPNGKVLVAGGCQVPTCNFTNNPQLTATAELYDPATGQWTRTGNMTAPREGHTATLLDSATGPCGSICGQVLVAFGLGGVDDISSGLTSAELFDPATGTWRATGSSSGTGRGRHSAVRLADGRVLVAGGVASNFFGADQFAAEIYNPVTEMWQLSGILNFARGVQPPLIRLPNGKVLILGGQSDIAEILNPADNQWRSASANFYPARILPAAALLPAGPVSACGTNCGKVLLAGGGSPSSSVPLPFGTAELYTPQGGASGPGPSSYVPLSVPVRVTDTRPASGFANAGHPIGFGSSITVPLAPSVPVGATAVVVNVTAVNGAAPGVLSAYPTGAMPPVASSLNYVPGPRGSCTTTVDCVVPNLVTVPVGTGGDVSILNSGAPGSVGSVDAVVDVEGYYVPAATGGSGHYYPSAPQRLADTRCAARPAPGVCTGESLPVANAGLSTVPAGGTLKVDTSAVPAPSGSVGAVVLNVTTTNTARAGVLTAFADGASLPTASNANWVAGQTSASRVIVQVGPGSSGIVDLHNESSGSTDIVVDANGYFSNSGGDPRTGSLFVPVTPTRITDTRPGSAQANAGKTLGAAGNLSVPVVGQAGVPVGALAAAVNVTAVNGTAPSYFSVLQAPQLVGVPPTSDLNFVPGEVRANADLATLGQGANAGTLDVYNAHGSADAVVDLTGYFVAPST